MSVDRRSEITVTSPVIGPIHSLFGGRGGCFAQPGQYRIGNFFFAVAVHQQGDFAFSVKGLFAPGLFCLCRIETDCFAGITQFRNVAVSAADIEKFELQCVRNAALPFLVVLLQAFIIGLHLFVQVFERFHLHFLFLLSVLYGTHFNQLGHAFQDRQCYFAACRETFEPAPSAIFVL